MSLLYSQANINRNELNLLPTPESLGRFHQPYGFGEYVDNIHESLDLLGLEVRNQEYETTHDNNRLFGALEVGLKEGDLITSDEWKVLVGLRASHDQSVARGLVIGSQVLVCSNLCFSGNIANINTKQTTHLGQRLPRLIRNAVDQIPELAHLEEQRFDAYKALEVKPRVGDAGLVELYRRGSFTNAQLAKAIHEWEEPTYEAHKLADPGSVTRSGWRLFNAATEALKPATQSSNADGNALTRRTQIVSNFLNECVGL